MERCSFSEHIVVRVRPAGLQDDVAFGSLLSVAEIKDVPEHNPPKDTICLLLVKILTYGYRNHSRLLFQTWNKSHFQHLGFSLRVPVVLS